MSKYMIHTCPKRKWYVDEFLVPSMIEQGIDSQDITVYNDENEDGHLMAFMNSWKQLKEGGTWHLQDDIITHVCVTFPFIDGFGFGFAPGEIVAKPFGLVGTNVTGRP